jgi:hypothetical protein
MIDIREVYPDALSTDVDGEPYWWGAYDYDPLLKSFGYEILLKVDDNGYQGDSRLIFKDGDRYGLLIFGWGSCSGCDALQACDSYEEIEELRQKLHNEIIWDTKEGLLKYIKEKDWELEWCWHYEETKRFVDEAIKLLSE